MEQWADSRWVKWGCHCPGFQTEDSYLEKNNRKILLMNIFLKILRRFWQTVSLDVWRKEPISIWTVRLPWSEQCVAHATSHYEIARRVCLKYLRYMQPSWTSPRHSPEQPQGLLTKLRGYGFHSKLLRWLKAEYELLRAFVGVVTLVQIHSNTRSIKPRLFCAVNTIQSIHKRIFSTE